MSTVLASADKPARLLGSFDAALAENISIFQNILELASRHVEALRSAPVEPPPRRTVPRRKVAFRAECCGTSGVSRCLISDVGDGGFAVVCGHPHAVGEVIVMRWKFGRHDLVAEVECIVRHVTRAHMGVELLHVSPGQRARLLASLEHSSAAVAA